METISTALIHVLLKLAIHQDVQAKLYEEIIGTFPDEKIAYDDIGKSKYLDAVVSETLRIHPAINRLFRICVGDTDFGEFKVNKGQLVGVSVYNIHHNPALFPEPDKFRPERFVNNEVDNNFLYLFGGGPSIVSCSSLGCCNFKFNLSLILFLLLI